MKNTYLQPSTEMGNMETEQMICGSQDITSNNGITYGGVDGEGTKDPSSRRRDVWADEEGTEEYFE